MKYNIFFIILLLSLSLSAQNVSKSRAGNFALTNATIETVTNGQIQGTLLIRGGKIADLGADINIPDDMEVIDCEGMTIYPGMIDGGTTVGLAEVGSVPLTQDANEIGDITPHVKALTAVNPNSVIIPVTRTNGVTAVITAPSGGMFPGTASLIHLHGYTPAQMDAGFEAIRMNFPSARRRGWRDSRSDEDRKKDMEKALKKLNDVWEQAALYARIESAYQKGEAEAPDYNPEMAALAAAVRGDIKLMIEVNQAKDIEAAISWVQEKELDVIFTGVAEGWRVADKIAEANIPVVTGPMLSTPNRSSDRYDRPYANAGMMSQAGVKVAIRTNESENARNLPFNAGFAAAYGMGKEEALKAVTINAAEIFGLSEQLGSLEKGKIASLFVSTGDPFEPASQIKYLFINGYMVPLDSRHIRLYNEFLEREPGLRKD